MICWNICSCTGIFGQTTFDNLFRRDVRLGSQNFIDLVVLFKRFPVVATSGIVVLYSFVLVLKVFNARPTLRTSAVAWYSLVFKNGIEVLCDGVPHNAVSFLADWEIVPPQFESQHLPS